MKIHLNGQIVDAADAHIGVEDAGFQHAVGLFETMAAYNGTVFRLAEHLDRLAASADQLGLTRDLNRNALITAVNEALAANDMTEARIRLTVTAGEVSMLRPPSEPPQPTVVVIATPPTQYDPKYFDDGVLVTMASPMANPFDPMAGHKTLNYWPRLRALRQSATAGASETILLNITNHLACGAISNVFIIKDDTLLTPFARGEEVEGALPAPVLPGITRAAVIELADQVKLKVERKMLTVDDLLEADEAFLTNSSWLLLPINRVEQKLIGGEGKVGEHTKALRAALLKTVAAECGIN